MYLGQCREGAIFKLEQEPREYRIVRLANFSAPQVWGTMYPMELKDTVFAMSIHYPEELYAFHPEQMVVVINDG